MKPSGASSLVSQGLESKPAETPTTTRQSEPATLPELGQADNRSKLKTQRLVQLCGQLLHCERKSETWFAEHEKFFRSPVWKLVSDEAIRKALFKCEYWKCSRQAKQAHLL